MYVLDTNVVSELRQGKTRPAAAVVAWAASVSMSRLHLTAISILELESGVLALERKAPPEGQALRRWLHGLREAFAGRILPFDDRAATLCAAMHVPRTRSERDAMIAGIALAHGMTVVTRNVSDFAGCGVALVNPWQHGSAPQGPPHLRSAPA